MLKINSPISVLPMVGPKYKTLLSKLEIFTISDLLYHFPFRYDDLSELKKIKELNEGETATVLATLGTIENVFSKYRKRLTMASIIDYTGNIDVIWFNQHYLKKTLKIGNTYFFSGKVQIFNNKITFVSPEVEEKKASNINTGRIVPIYPETQGINSKWIRSRIDTILKLESDIHEFLPEELIKSRKLKDLKESFRQIHFPDSFAEAEHSRKRFAFEELFLELLNVERRKNEWAEIRTSYKMRLPNESVSSFVNELPFDLSKSQTLAVDELIEDMKKTIPMNRLLEGDVGSGKTIVAVIAAYYNFINGYRTIYMAPTEILAVQHYNTFKTYLEVLGVKIGLATSNTKIKEGEYDILIGTHALLYSKIGYDNTALVIIDEQHRFGVEQRSNILKLNNGKITPHMLTMTATPIPRTLALTIYGDLAISAIKSRPDNIRQVSTKVIGENQRELTYQWIKQKNESTFIVCPLIDRSEHESLVNVKAAEDEFVKLSNGIFKGTSMGLLHGRMKPKEKDEIVDKFRKGEIKILVSTPVIEVGIDIPDASIIVIESSERYGLASLHQLRGRVGRGSKEGYCFLFLSSWSKNAFLRLKNLENINDGLELAEIDMKNRGQGDIFGTMQSGFKTFKIAKLEDLEMLASAKMEAQRYFSRIQEFPMLEQRLNERKGKEIKNN